ncbi:hypothetical protein PMT97_12420 [Enterococcus faecalis]|uniref:hypothetical protein n=1 Tax=Enterococcus faecalis TaxID=1351 RepID=UPI00232E247E|nr:hypothetical protein [Enterococcus faecalis]MDB1624911.1 hypothetical protein [Enterococcus faecalis]
MDITDKEKFQKQMDFLKTHNFQQYIYQYRWSFLFIPLLGLLDLVFDGISWWIGIKIVLLISILISEYYLMYHFFKPFAMGKGQITSRFQLFLGLLLCNGLFMFVVLTNFRQNFTNSNFNIWGSLMGSIFFGLMMSGLCVSYFNEQVKDYLKTTSTTCN